MKNVKHFYSKVTREENCRTVNLQKLFMYSLAILKNVKYGKQIV